MVPTVVTSYDEYRLTFGTTFVSGSYYYEYLTSIAARNFFENGGNTLLVTRVVSGSGATFKTYASASVATTGSPLSSSFTLAVNDFGSAYNGLGTQFTRKWHVTEVNTDLGTFSLDIRRGDDTDVNKIILETWRGLSLDPMQPNYIGRVIGDSVEYYDSVTSSVKEEGNFTNNSNYIYVKSVDSPLLDSLDNNGYFKSAFIPKLPAVNSSGSFNGGTDGLLFNGESTFYEQITGTPTNVQGFTALPYTQALSLLSNKTQYDFKVIALPGISPDNANMGSVVTALSGIINDRQDCMGILDPTVYGSTVTQAKSSVLAVDNNGLAAYWPWVQLYNPEIGRNVWVPASTLMVGVYNYTDKVAAEWYAPAGFRRGGLVTANKAEKKLTSSEIGDLYNAGVNPIATFPNEGLVVWGQNTLQKKLSHLRKVGVKRLVINIKRKSEEIARTMVFEQNTAALRNDFKAKLNPYLEKITQQQGLYAYRVIMDETNNTSDVIDRYEVRGEIIIQPTTAAEFIRLNITVAASGVDITV
jgi:phage tail sheath protein FI